MNRLLSGAVASLLFVVACAPAEQPAATSKPAAPAATGPTAAPAAAGAASSEPIRIGLVVPLTGTLAQSGKDNLDAFNLYLEQVNSTIAGRKVEVVVGDDEGSADTGLSKAKQLVDNNKVQFLAGLSSTAVCYAVAGYVKQAQVPLVVTSNCGAEDLTINEQFATPYLVRTTQVLSEMSDTMADYMYNKGFRRVMTITGDYAGGVQTIGGFQSAFIKRGGTVIQEFYPKLGTTDFGPFLAQIDQSADAIASFVPGADALRFAEQYDQYASKKLPIFDMFGQITHGALVPQLQDKALGVISNAVYSSAYDSPENKSFLDAWKKKYPDRIPSFDTGNAYSGAQVIEAAIKKVNGNVEDKQAFLKALYETDTKTAKGPLKLDEHHDVIQNIYVFQLVKNGQSYDQQLLQTYENVSITWDRTLDEVKSFPWGETKGKFLNINKDQLTQVLKS
ncbi:MAG: ABC transporter substrate-binding protein [Chloroflexi bacterium]|nr:ABC transporter substrate-binding protein [Chloroflexota bacterium]